MIRSVMERPLLLLWWLRTGPDPNQRAVMSAPGINVSVPSPEYLLALKVAAARVDRDTDDIRVLAELAGTPSWRR